MRLTQRLFLLVLIALLPALAIQAYNEFDLRRTRQAEVDEMALRQAKLASSELNQIFEGIHNLLIAVAEVPSVRSFAADECAAYLAHPSTQSPLSWDHRRDRHGRQSRLSAEPCTARASPDGSRLFQGSAGTGVFLVGDYTESRISGRASYRWRCRSGSRRQDHRRPAGRTRTRLAGRAASRAGFAEERLPHRRRSQRRHHRPRAAARALRRHTHPRRLSSLSSTLPNRER